jgi:uncharacterized phage protein gp47/JayE
MAIFIKDPNEILAEARTRLIENTEVTNIDPGGTARAIVEVVAASQGDQYTDLSFNINQAFVSNALGENLDLIGVLLNVRRGEQTRAHDTTYKNFRFFIDPATQFAGADVAAIANSWLNQQGKGSNFVDVDSFTVPAGTTINNRAGGPFTTTEDAVFGPGDTEVFVPVQATVLGILGNAGPAALNTHNLAEEHSEFTPVANIILSDNLLPITNGKDIENDDSYRFRIINQALASRHANITAVRLSALSVPGVSDVNIKNFSHGVGTYSVFVLSIDPIVSTGTLNAVQAAVAQTSAAGIRAVVQSPIYRGLEMNVSLEFFPDVGQIQRDEIKAAVRQTVVDYVNNIEMGTGFIVNRVIQVTLDVSNRIKDAHVANMFIGEYNSDTAVNERRFPVFVVNQNLFWDEKFYTNAGMITLC